MLIQLLCGRLEVDGVWRNVCSTQYADQYMGHVDELISTLARMRYDEHELSKEIQHLDQQMRSHKWATEEESRSLALQDKCRQQDKEITELRTMLVDESEERKKADDALKALLGQRV
jgi:predicted RNase H-like nuclease (RuvC/YqgF family)